MTNYGYIRKEFPVETLKQIHALLPHECEELFIEESDLGSEHELQRLMEVCEAKDTIIIYHSCVFEKNLRSYAKIIEEFMDKQVDLLILDEKIDTHIEKNYYTTVKKIADMERYVLQKKTIYGIKNARNDGRVGGRPKITETTIKNINHLRNVQKLPLRKISELCNVSLGTVHKYIHE